MNASDFNQFSNWFDILAVTHRLSVNEDLKAKMKAEYFDVLRSYPMDAVETSYQNLRRKMKKWPVPADWLEALPPFGSIERLTPLTADEKAQNDEAETLGYEREEICKCRLCVEADCVMPPRYVPRVNGEVIPRRDPVRMGRPVLLGRWLHGKELKSWYAARARYYEQKTVVWAALLKEKTLDSRQRIEKLAVTAKVAIMQNAAPVNSEQV